MNKIEMSLGQSAKVWWSFMWRGWVLTMPILFLMMIGMFFLIPFPKPGQPPQPQDFKQMPYFFVIWLAMMSWFILSQVFALRWALRAEWSDFRILVISASSEKQN